MQSLLNVSEISSSKPLIACVIKQRSIKSDYELSEINSALEITSQMHSIAMRSTRDGLLEQEIVGLMEGYALQNGSRNGLSRDFYN